MAQQLALGQLLFHARAVRGLVAAHDDVVRVVLAAGRLAVLEGQPDLGRPIGAYLRDAIDGHGVPGRAHAGAVDDSGQPLGGVDAGDVVRLLPQHRPIDHEVEAVGVRAAGGPLASAVQDQRPLGSLIVVGRGDLDRRNGHGRLDRRRRGRRLDLGLGQRRVAEAEQMVAAAVEQSGADHGAERHECDQSADDPRPGRLLVVGRGLVDCHGLLLLSAMVGFDGPRYPCRNRRGRLGYITGRIAV